MISITSKALAIRAISWPFAALSTCGLPCTQRHHLSTLASPALLSALPVVPAPSVSPSLTDRFGRQHTYLRISVTERCNLRCTYCMPAEGVTLTPADNLLSTQEIIRLLTLFTHNGINKVRFTGGEPTVRSDLVDIVQAASALHSQGLHTRALTSNGIVLGRKLPALVKAGLTHVNISLDTMDADKFQIITRRQGHARVLEAIQDALDTQSLVVKVNCVVMKGVNDYEILDFVSFTQDRDLEVRFIEYMPFEGNRWSDRKFFSYADMLTTIRQRYPQIQRMEQKTESGNDVSKVWHIPGWKGRVGFITSMSDHFCDTCNRLRITADGQLKVCLFDNKEVSLRDAMRQGMGNNELRSEAERHQPIRQSSRAAKASLSLLAVSYLSSSLIAAAVQKKKAKHAGRVQNIFNV